MAVSPPPNFDLREALDPFSIEETHRLRRYVELAEELKGCRFFQPRKQTLEISFSAEDGMTFTLPHGDDDELITAMAARLRTLHTEGSPGGHRELRTDGSALASARHSAAKRER